MKKGCLIALCAIALLIVVGVAAAGFIVNRQYGLSVAEQVSHETMADAQTRLRAVLKADKLRELILRALPPGTNPPAWLPWETADLVDEVLPREVALLGGPDYSAGQYRFTLFANERRGGPLIVQYVNESQLFDSIQMVQWDPELAVLRQRGVITAKGGLPMPSDTEMLVLESWTHDPPAEPLGIEGDHLLEITLDNRNGDGLALLHTILTQQQVDYRQMAAANPPLKGLIDLIPQIFTIRAEADFVDSDTARVVIRIFADPKAQSQLTFLPNFILVPELKKFLSRDYGLALEGESVWDEKQSMAIGEFTITGTEQLLQRSLPQQPQAAAPPH